MATPLSRDEIVKLCRQWTPQGLASFYELIFSTMDPPWKLPKHLWPVVLALCDVRIRKLMLVVGPGSGKALHPDTPILTTKGWTAIKNVKVGDEIVTPDGTTPAAIRAVLPQPKGKMFRITFDDGREVLANAKHLWRAHMKKFNLQGKDMSWRLRTTEELAVYLKNDKANRWYVPLTKPVDCPAIDLPVDPYVLGALLGDGHIGPNGFPVMTSFDPEIIERMRSGGVELSDYHGKGRYGVLGLCKTLGDLGLANSRSWDKFIPKHYFSGSAKQRWELLQGLMDTDGYVGPSGSLSYCTTSPQLAKDIQKLIWSLGGIVQITEKIPVCTYKSEKIKGKKAYIVNIRHETGCMFFNLPRNKELARKTQYSGNLKLQIASIEQVEDSESICISIGHPDGLFLCADHVVTHNSQLLSVVFPAWVAGHNPNSTILGISGGESLMQGFQSAVMEIVERSDAWKLIFPNVMPDKSAGWSNDRGMFVTGRKPGIPDATYLAAGLQSRYLVGKHAKTLVIDDLHDDSNSLTEEQCAGVVRKYYNTILGRADPMGARFIVAGRRWHENDIYGKLQRSNEWVVMTLPAERAGKKGLYFDITVPDNMDCVFTDRLVVCADDTVVKV